MNKLRTVLALQAILVLPAAARAQATVPSFSHVYIIVMENHEFSDIIGNPNAPYINQLAQQYALGTAYTAITHPSLPNYMTLTGGETVFTNDCEACTVSASNIADQIETAGRNWKAYMEDMPAPCSTNDSGLYTTHHNPFIHYDDIVTNASRCQAHVVPLSQFATDVSAHTVPDYVWITPDLCSDMHDCSVAMGDAWLASMVPTILATPDFNSSVLFLVWDEGTSDTGGGGQVPMLVISPLALPGFQSTVAENHFSLLRTIQDAWGLGTLGQTATATAMTEYFQTRCQDTLALSYGGTTLNIGFTVMTPVPGVWTTWLITSLGSGQLWSISIPVVSPSVSFTVPIAGFPHLGTVGVVTIVRPSVGTLCGDAKAVNTGP
jgi:acid phosphatase